MKRYDQCFWSVDFPDMWIVQDDNSPITFFEKDGDWAIQISYYLKEAAPVTDTDLQEFIADKERPGCVKREITTLNVNGLQVEFTEEKDTTWRHTLLRSGHVMLYVTYNVKKYGRELDGPSFQNFIESIQIKGEQAGRGERK